MAKRYSYNYCFIIIDLYDFIQFSSHQTFFTTETITGVRHWAYTTTRLFSTKTIGLTTDTTSASTIVSNIHFYKVH